MADAAAVALPDEAWDKGMGSMEGMSEKLKGENWLGMGNYL